MTLHAEPPVTTEPVPTSQAVPSRPMLAPPSGWHQLGLLALGAILLSLSFAPIGQFYLAWVGLAPMLIVVARSSSVRSAFVWGWVAGTIFFLLNMAYLLLVTIPGALLLPPYLALYWAAAFAVIRCTRLLASSPSPGTPGEGWGEGSARLTSDADRSGLARTLTLPSPGVPGEG